MNYSELSCAEFCEKLSTKAPVPGGGGVSALVGALAAALGSMVGALTVGKKKYAASEPEIRREMEKTDALRRELLALIEEDARAFAPLARAYGMPKETDAQKALKEKVLEKCLKDAADVPFRILKKIGEAVPCISVFADKGSVIALSDAGVAASLAGAAMKSAALNVSVNTRLMKDRTFAAGLNAQTAEILERSLPEAERIYEKVRSRLSN